MTTPTRNAMQQHIFLFKLATVFLTRLPVQINATVEDKDINAASGYFPAVGALIASLVGIIMYVSSLVFPIEIAVLLSMVASLFITGVFHEDGLADTADGFGGGWSAQQKLHIMKDSRLGTYGTAALIMALLLKFQTLLFIAQVSLPLVFVALIFAHMFSRILALSVISSSSYVEAKAATASDNNNEQNENAEKLEKAQSKTKPVAQSLSSQSVFLLQLFSAIAMFSLLVFTEFSVFATLALVAVLWLVRCLLIRFYHQQIQGYNGDVLGATQQVIELCCYLGFIALVGLSS